MFLGVGRKGVSVETGRESKARNKDRWERTHRLLFTGGQGESQGKERLGKTRQALSSRAIRELSS